MIQTKNLLFAGLLTLLSTLMVGCSGGDSADTASSSTGTVALSLTDAPIDDESVKGVYVTFDSLRYQYVDGNDSWQDIDLNESRTINLLALQDGNTTLLSKVDLPSGEIQHVRFMIDTKECYIELIGGIEKPIEVPSADQTGYKSIGGFTIPAGGTVNVTADFDLRKSLTVTGNGRYKLNPTIKIIDNVEVGQIDGNVTIDTNGSKVIVYAYPDDTYDDNESNATNNFSNAILSTDATDGSYVLPWLSVGTFDLVVVAYDSLGVFENILGFINDVQVTTGQTTKQDITETTLEDSL